MTIEDKLKKKGYTLQEIYQNIEEAKKTALKWRQAGYKARVVKYSTSVKGWYDYGVWVKIEEYSRRKSNEKN